MAAENKAAAMKLINKLNLKPYAESALGKGELTKDQVDDAMTQYRQHLLLLWVNHVMSYQELVVPSIIADAIWHEHLEDVQAYNDFCVALVGGYIKHDPTLKKGSPGHKKATEHTNVLHREHGSDGFMSVYAVCGGSVSPAKPVAVEPTNHAHHDSSHHDSGGSGHGHGGHSDGGSSGPSCGGSSGCGGGGGCGG